MKTPTESVLVEALTTTLETLCFADVEECDEDELEGDFEGGVKVSFKGDYAGHVTVRVGGDVLGDLTENILGSPDAGEKERRDALREIGNIVTGTLLPLWVGEGATIELAMPQVVSDEETDEETLGGASVSLDEGWATIAVSAAANDSGGTTSAA